MTTDKPEAPERIWTSDVDSLHRYYPNPPTELQGHPYIHEYIRADLYPANTAKVMAELEQTNAELESNAARMKGAIQSACGALVRGDFDPVTVADVLRQDSEDYL